jgi:long-chain acyl-CoA synthetase
MHGVGRGGRKRSSEDGGMKPCNLVELIRAETSSVREKLAIMDGPVELTYAQLLSAVDRVADTLVAQGVKPLERVAFLCEDCADYIIGSLAILRVGAVVVPVSPSLMGDELEQVLDRMDVHALVYDTAIHSRTAGRELESAGLYARVFGLFRRDARDDLPPEYAHLNPAFIRFSSGTTGTSKGILLSHETIVSRTDAADHGMHITDRDVVIWVLSMSFHFVVTILLYLRRGATIMICRQPFPESFLDAAKRRRGTVFYASPFHYHTLAMSPLVPADCLSNVRLAISTAMKLSDETAAAFAKKFGFELVEAYGIIELGLPFINASDGRRKRGGVGRIQPGYEVRIDKPDAESAGVIQIRGPGMFDAYVSPWRNREAVLADGWFDTGDVGRIDEDGDLFILGREKNVINFVGMKIFPYEVEDVVASHPAVKECLVYGTAHPQFGHLPCVQIVLKDGVAKPDVKELRRFCYERLAEHKVPKEYVFVGHLDRTASGKVKR